MVRGPRRLEEHRYHNTGARGAGGRASTVTPPTHKIQPPPPSTMMDADAHTICRPLERPLDVYENERFWVGRGFSRKGLLPTERKAYSTADGSLSWRTLREAALSLLRCDGGRSRRRQGRRRGWSYHEYDGRQQPQAQAVQETAPALVTLEEDSDYECSTEDGADGGRLSLDERCGFEVYIDENATCDHEGWSYYPGRCGCELRTAKRFTEFRMPKPATSRLQPKLDAEPEQP